MEQNIFFKIKIVACVNDTHLVPGTFILSDHLKRGSIWRVEICLFHVQMFDLVYSACFFGMFKMERQSVISIKTLMSELGQAWSK
jgi:hypothetical protein